jgi:dTDP-4-dehydrorhamnose reductase
MTPLELWGGVECTRVRVGNEVRDQLHETGHFARLSDIDAMAELGVKAVRYPILWEHIASQSPSELDFSWHDERLDRLRRHGIRVIGGLLHHGSGPPFTDLLDPAFPDLFADYARRVASHYPWIDAWNPINEPFTTARFSYLYGAWHPHGQDINLAFRATVNQCLAIGRAMAAIREINPDAELIASEDIGKTFATADLQYQADHENDRRWLTFDLLAGKVIPGHPFYRWLLNKAATEEQLAELVGGLARPDIIGFDHYLTSERFLDHRLARYPGVAAGSNGRHDYVDVDAVRIARLQPQLGPLARLQETWDRYHIPIAVTEVHHSCTRDEQVRWFSDVWTAAERARQRGIDVRAVTIWAMFGLVDWRSVLTRHNNIYDSGPFDIRGPAPRATLLAKAAATFGRGEKFDHPLLDLPGWWRRPGRTYARPNFAKMPRRKSGRPLLITGATGTLGQAFARICAHRGLAHVATIRADLDITSASSIAAALDRHRPWAVVNTAGCVRPGDADANQDECWLANVAGPELLARACKRHGIPLVTFSSDLVFDGSLGRAYAEPDKPAPACAYGRSKAEAEARLTALGADALVIRTSAFFGPWDKYNFLYSTIDRLRQGKDVIASDRAIVSPTYLPDLVHAALDLLLDQETGIWHLTNQGAISWHDFALEAARIGGVSAEPIRKDQRGPVTDTSLTSKRGLLLQPLDRAFSYLADRLKELA